MPQRAFSSSYFEARERFREAAEALGLTIDVRDNPHTKGPGGETLTSDLVTVGDPEAPGRVLMISATHGVEGFCGSGAQIAFLSSLIGKDRPDDVCFVLLHALNPHGFAWLRRVNENNIDLNRNFISFEEDPPINEHYETLRPTMIVDPLSDQAVRDASRAMVRFGKEHGFDVLQEGLTKGQYTDDEGLYFGGHGPSWSNELLRDVLQTRLTGAKRAVQIDFHTGLGPSGYGEIITEYAPDDARYDLAREWLGADVTSTVGGSSSSAALTGTTDHAFHQELPDVTGVSVALEFGTVPSDDVFNATRADNWLHLTHPEEEVMGHPIKSDMRAAFYQDELAWKEKVLARADDVIGRAVRALSDKPAGS